MAAKRVERRLAAILCADIVGYSRLMGVDEEGTLAALKGHRRELIDPLLVQHQGRIVKTMGDGLLIEFASVVDAVRCAIVMQQGMDDRNANLPESERITFRVGINLGDIIVDAGDIFGDGVNVAARLEALAEPGEVWVSASVREQIGDKLPIDFAEMGKYSVKNITRPIHVYRVEKRMEVHEASKKSHQPSLPLPLPDRASIAVLAFANMSGDAEQEYFGDGIAEDIITALSRCHWFFVIARNSSFTYKSKTVDVRTIGRELGVRYVLEGSVRKGGDRLRITAQLVEAATGNHLWAEKYDGALEEIFDLQDRITEGVVGAIEPSVRHAEIERARRKKPESLDAYDLYLRALPDVWANTAPESVRALKFLDDALRIDPSYAAAHGPLPFANLSSSYKVVSIRPIERLRSVMRGRFLPAERTIPTLSHSPDSSLRYSSTTILPRWEPSTKPWR
jgi:adenylate cyclase